jgi:hypothetical protein
MKRIKILPVLAAAISACSAAANSNSSSPVVQQSGTLNVIAVGVAVAGGLIGFALSRRQNKPEEPVVKTKKKKNRGRR